MKARCRIALIVSCAFAGGVMLVHPLIVHDGFFDINRVKAYSFIFAAYIAFILRVIFEKRRALRGRPCLFFGAAFAAVLTLSVIFARDTAAALFDFDGRQCGAVYFGALLCAAYVCAGESKSRLWSVPAFLCAGAPVCALAALNFFHIDPFGFYTKLSARYAKGFISTIGNTDFFAAFLSLYLPLACVTACETRGLKRIFALVCAGMGAAGVIWCRADGAFIALGASAYLLLRRGAFDALACVTGALSAAGVLCHAFKTHIMSLNGCLCRYIAEYPAVCAALAAACALIYIVQKRRSDRPYVRAYRQTADISAGLFVACVCAAFVYFTFIDRTSVLDKALSHLRFSDTWGTYRGAVWTRALRLYLHSDVKTLLLGYGPGGLSAPLWEQYGAELASIAGRRFNDAHSSLIQYLLTTGALGLGTLCGLISCALARAFKNGGAPGNAALCAAVTYILHSLLTVTQPETGPLFVVLLFSAYARGSADAPDKKRYGGVTDARA